MEAEAKLYEAAFSDSMCSVRSRQGFRLKFVAPVRTVSAIVMTMDAFTSIDM